MRKSSLYRYVLILLIVGTACIFLAYQRMERQSNHSEKGLIYLPLGDSYTIGTGIDASGNFPNQLTAALKKKGIALSIPHNPARNGYTTKRLIAEELGYLDTYKPQFVTLLIGVNDWVQAVDIITFEENLDHILKRITTHESAPKLLVITIPDFGVAPSGKLYASPDEIKKGIASFNKVIKKKAAEYKILVADIYPVSQQAKSADMFASDGLHPSAKGYAEWVKVILPSAEAVLKK